MNKKAKIPVILYEETTPGQPVNPIPYIEVAKDDDMPKVLFVSEYKETGEFEPDAQFGSRPIVDMLIHKYVDLDFIKTKLDQKTFDKIRVALGMQPLKVAQKEGAKILKNVFENAENNKRNLETNKEVFEQRVFSLGEKLKNKLNSLKDESETEE